MHNLTIKFSVAHLASMMNPPVEFLSGETFIICNCMFKIIVIVIIVCFWTTCYVTTHDCLRQSCRL